MGTVYLAEQREPIHRQVALKIIKHGLDSKDVIARFESERQALALMDHPSIARVLDAGTADSGVPYFVMEYVRGIPITEYCDRHQLKTRQRLELFCDVCNAIHHAHQRGVIHRDIKPSNVLVELVDGKPLPKVIDFGVAKATHQRLTERTLFTNIGVMVGTPAYMSPEQTGGADLEVDTTTDIYSLGIMLYELLVGAVPFDPAEMRRLGFAEMLRVIREVEPPKPSDRLRSSGARASDVAKLRATDVQMLVKELRGDLEFITMRALEKDRARRYPSASEFAADIVRHLHDEPVVAGPPDAMYRLSKFARRHKGPIVAATAVMLSMVAGLVVSSLLYLRSERQRTEALRKDYAANLAAAGLALKLVDVSTAQNRLLRCDPGMRGFEWWVLWGRSDSSLATLYTDSLFADVTYPRSGMAFSDDRRRISWGFGNAVHSWDASTYQPIQVYGGFGSLVAISRDGSQVLASTSGLLSLVDLTSGTVRAKLEFPEDDRLTGAALSPSGGRIATGTLHSRFRVWDSLSVRNLLDVKLVSNPTDPMSTSPLVIAFQQTGLRVAALSFAGTLSVWDTGTGRLLMRNEIPETGGSLGRLDFSPDGNRIAVGSGPGARVLEVSSGKVLLNLPAHAGIVAALKFSPDGALIASTALDDGAVQLWNSSTGEQVASLLGGHVGGLTGSLAFSPDGRQLWAGFNDGEARVWDVPTLGGEFLQHLPRSNSSFALSPDGTQIAVTQPGAVEIWDAATGAKINSWKTGSEKLCYGDTCFTSAGFNYDSVTYSPDGSHIATGSRDGAVGIWDSRSGAAVQQLRGHASAVTAIAFDPAGTHLASGAWDQTAIVWDLRSGHPVNRMRLAASVVSLFFTPGGDRLVIACGNTAHPANPGSLVTLWQTLGGQSPIRQFPLPATVKRTWAAALSKDGKSVAATSPAGVSVWDTASGNLIGSGYTSEASQPIAIAFSPDGSRLAAGAVNGALRLFDTSGNELLNLSGHGQPLRSVAFSPDGDLLYSSGLDGNVRVWGTGSAYLPGAAELVDSLREQFYRWRDVSSRIEARRGLDSKLRQAALELARRRGDDIGHWNRDTLATLRDPKRTDEEYRTALQSATAALQAYPWNPALLSTLGAAQYRTGRYREAIETLLRSESLSPYPTTSNLILIAMTHYRLGEIEKARTELEAAVPIRSHYADAQPSFLDEADSLISPIGPGH
jgi:eukaryotic-like serine/threonine-protein kinase